MCYVKCPSLTTQKEICIVSYYLSLVLLLLYFDCMQCFIIACTICKVFSHGTVSKWYYTIVYGIIFSPELKRNQWRRKLLCKESSLAFDHSDQCSSLTVSSSSQCRFECHSYVSPLPYQAGILLWERTSRADKSGAQRKRNTEDERCIHWSAVHRLISINVLHCLFKTLDIRIVPQWKPRVPVLLKH